MKVKSYYLIAILFCLLSGCDLDDSSLPSNKAKILFISARIENRPDWNLLSMNWDGSDQHKITELLVRCDKPVVSHSGKMVLFVHYTDDFDYELYLVNVDGTNLTLIDKANRYCGSADWSFDDQKIIYSKNRDETTEEKDLILYDVASKTRHILTSVGDNALGRFSPDHQIAYCHHSENGSYDIYVMQIDGAQNQKLVSNATCPV